MSNQMNQSPQEMFLNILTNCLSEDNNLRKSAEANVDSISETNYEDVLFNCSEFLKSETIQVTVRQLCATIIKNFISREENIAKWRGIQKEKKDIIKSNVLSCLGSSLKEIRRAAAISVAAIGKEEIPNRQWDQLIQTLQKASVCQNLNYQLSVIITLGFLCQELGPNEFVPSDKEIISSIIFNFLNQATDIELIFETLNALYHFLDFLSGNMKNDEFRQNFFKKLVDFINSQSSNDDIKIIAIRIITDSSKLYYEEIEKDIDNLTQLSTYLIRSDNEKIAVQGYMFWITMSEEEIWRVKSRKVYKGYCQRYIQTLWNEISNTLLTKYNTFEKQESDEFNTYSCVSYLLENLSKLVDPGFLNVVFNFMNSCFDSNEPSKMTAAIFAFSSIIETKYEKEMKDVIPFIVTKLCTFITIDNSNLKLVISYCFKKLCEIQYEVFYQSDELFDLLINTILKMIVIVPNRLIVNFCHALYSLANNLKKNFYLQSTTMSKHMESLLCTLINLAYRENAFDHNSNVLHHSFTVIGTLVETSQEKEQETIKSFFASIYNLFTKSLDINNFNNNEEKRNAYQNELANVIVAYANSRKITMNKEQGMMTYELIKKSFVQRSSVYEEGIVACSSLVFVLGKDFLEILADFMQYLKFGLQNWQDASVCKQSLLAVGDIIRGLEGDCVEYLKQLMPLVFDVMNCDSDKSLKVQVLMIFSDISCFISGIIWDYYDVIMNYVSRAMEVAVILPNEDDVDLVEYYSLLRERIIEFLSSISRAVVNNDKKEKLEPFLDSIVIFISRISSDSYALSESTLNECAGILDDLCQLFKNEMAEKINDDCVRYITNKLKKSKDEGYAKYGDKLLTQIFMLRINSFQNLNELP